MTFEWNDVKAWRNLRNHGVSFSEAEKAFDDPDALEGDDEKHSRDEARQWTLAQSPRAPILLIVFTVRFGEIVRLISARKATLEECELFETEKIR